jgi:serine/threonine-protein kinase
MLPGSRFGRYTLVERRGGGGMGEIWHARLDGPRGFARSVVLKRLRREHTGDAALVAMLSAEARVGARLDHPGIVKVFEFGEVDGEHYLAMELIDGWTLAEVVEACDRTGRTLPLALVCHVGAALADALAYAHALTDEAGHPLGLVHRDVNPANVMLTRQGGTKLLDFGVHTIRDRWPDERTESGAIKGTLAYMSPEQAEGASLDHRSDLFSLGVVLHEAATGRRLFRVGGDSETLAHLRAAPIPAPSALRRELDGRFDKVILRLLAREPRERYPDAGQLAAELRGIATADDARLRDFLAELELGAALPQHRLQRGTARLLPSPPGLGPWLAAALITAAVTWPYLLGP